MKLLMLIDALGKGGKERRMLELIKGLINSNESFDIVLISLTNTVGYEYVYDLPIRFITFDRKGKFDLSIIFKIRSVIKSFKPDIIHSWSTMASVYMLFAKKLSSAPFINGFIADAPTKIDFFDKYYWRVKLTSLISDAFVSNSLAGIKAYNTPSNKTYCINNGIDFDRFKNLRTKSEIEFELLGSLKDQRIVIVMVASFTDKKDYETLIVAAIRLCNSNNKLLFLLIGDGPTLEPNKIKCIKAGLEERIIFAGKRNDIESILQVADIGVLITHGEGISNSIIEYMAMGLPVIASKGGGTNELIEDGKNGFMIDAGNVQQLVDKIDHLVQNKNSIKLMGDYAHTWVRNKFDLKLKTDEYIFLYKKLLDEKIKSSI